MKKALFLIDVQNDFCVTSDVAKRLNIPEGTLAVTGAWEDGERIAEFIRKTDFHTIVLTQDTHHVINISHPSFWADKNGNAPGVFTQITLDDVHKGIWIPQFNPVEAIKYIENLHTNGEFTHTIWPEHCIAGSQGAAIVEPVMKAVKEWAAKYRKFHVMVQKGEHPMTEHFGALRANVPIASAPATMTNQRLIQTLMQNDIVYLAGEARSHCTANTLKQLMTEASPLLSKIIVLEDCMSDVFNPAGTGWPEADAIYAEAKSKGVKFEKSI